MSCPLPPPPLHLFFFPLMAPGHIIPMANMAILLSNHGIQTTIITTPSNTSLIHHHISGHPVQVLLLHHSPSMETNPSEADEGLASITSAGMSMRFFIALESLRGPFGRLLRCHRPDCVVSDMFLPWTADVASDLSIPRVVFHGMGFFPLCVLDRLGQGDIVDDDPVLIPDLPHPITMKRSQIHDSVFTPNEFGEFMDRIVASEKKSHSTIVNSFYELESEYADHYRNSIGRKAWHIGPIMSPRPPAATNGDHQCDWLEWLNSQEQKSVVYVCFGSLCRLTRSQLHEIELGLEASGHPYLWVVRDDSTAAADGGVVAEEASGGKKNGMVLHGWAPQVAVLQHVAVGGFVTHCGWNSVMEAVVSATPMATWPLCSEQFYNERLVVDVLQVGLAVGAEEWGMKEEEKRVVRREEVMKAVQHLMDGGEEGEERRRRAEELKKKAEMAVVEGGSSFVEVGRLIEELTVIRGFKIGNGNLFPVSNNNPREVDTLII